MNERLNIFTSENIISTLGIKIDDSFECKLVESNGSFPISSSFIINKKNQDGVCFETDNYADTSSPCIVAIVHTFLDKQGNVTPVIDIDNEQMETVVNICNKYLKVYMIMYDIKNFDEGDTVYLSFLADYHYCEPLVLKKLTCSRIILRECNYQGNGPMQTNVNAFVHEFLSSLNITELNEHTDMDTLCPLVEMQKNINHMIRI